jgi:hypothetical protein
MFSATNKNSVNQKIVIQYNDKDCQRYSLKIYFKYPFLKAYISKEKFADILDKANIIINDSKLKKAKFDKIEINNWIYILIALVLIFIVIYICLFYYIPRTEKHHKGMRICGIVFFFLSILILFIIEGHNSLRTIESSKTLFDFYKDDMINYIKELNDEYKDSMIFEFDEKNKNIICHVKPKGKDANKKKDKKFLGKIKSMGNIEIMKISNTFDT